MSKKDYHLVANILRDSAIDGDDFDRLVTDFSVAFKSDNPLFDEVRFRNACQSAL